MANGWVLGVMRGVAFGAFALGAAGCGDTPEVEQATVEQYRYHDGLGHEFVLSEKFNGVHTAAMAESAAKTAEAAFVKEMRVVRGYQPYFYQGEDVSNPANLVMGCIIVNESGFTGGVSTERCWTTSHVRQSEIDQGVKPGYVLKNRVAEAAYGPVTVAKED